MPQFVGDVFGLSAIYDKQVLNTEQKNFSSWPESTIYGYFGGGITPSIIYNTITRLDFSNETVSDPGKNLLLSIHNLSATSSSSYGYFGGGLTPSTYTSTITRLDFSNETVSDPGKNLPSARGYLTATSSSSYGYFGGGLDPTHTSTISRIDFSSETVSNTTNLPSARYSSTATSSSSYGYFGGGITPPLTFINTISRLDFSNETVNDSGNNLPSVRSRLAATSSNSYGYFGGSYITPLIFRSTISRLDFSNETVSDTTNLPSERGQSASTSNSSYGYFGGGSTSTTYINTISRLDFSNETVSDPGNNLPSERGSLASTSGGASVLRPNKTYGYFGGGETSIFPSTVLVSSIDRLDFTTETFSNPGNNLSNSITNTIPFSSNYYGYFGGGYNPILPILSPNRLRCAIERLDFSNETVSAGRQMPISKFSSSAVSSSSYGYFGGGSGVAYNSFDFLTEVTKSLGPYASYTYKQEASCASDLYGYFGGGYGILSSPPTNGREGISNTQRLDFSTSTVDGPNFLSSNLSSSRKSHVGSSNNLYGYFAGGFFGYGINPPYLNFSTIDRLDFSNETIIDSGKRLSISRLNLGSFSNNFYGYFGGGYSFTPPSTYTIYSRMDRLDFSTDTVNTSTNLPTSKTAYGLSNSN